MVDYDDGADYKGKVINQRQSFTKFKLTKNLHNITSHLLALIIIFDKSINQCYDGSVKSTITLSDFNIFFTCKSSSG
jgi:hypothetical protein